jgi:hypothetical protein
MAFAKFGSPAQVRSNVAEAMSIQAGERVMGAAGKKGAVVEAHGLTLSVLYDGDDDPTTVSSTEVRRVA